MNRNPSLLFLIIPLLLTTPPVQSQNPDIRVFRWINHHHSTASDRFFSFQSNTVKPVTIGLPIGLIAGGLVAENRHAENSGTLLFLAHCVNLGLTYGLKITVNRPRPYESLSGVHLPAGKEKTRSFPSGHTSAAFTSATLLSLSYPKWYVFIPSYTWAAMVGYSRIALGVHYPSDVLAGALIGSGVALLIYHYRAPILKEKKRLAE